MHVTIFGATGGTGRAVLSEALAAGHEVTVLVRDESRLGSVDPSVRIVVGDAQDASAVAAAVQGADAVVSAIGTHGLGRSTVITDCMTTIVGALPAGRRLLAVSTVGAGDSMGQFPLPARLTIGTLLRNAIADHNGQEQAIMSSDLDWTIARCVGLTDAEGGGEVHVIPGDGGGRVGGSRIARADVARWLVANLDSSAYSRQAVSLW